MAISFTLKAHSANSTGHTKTGLPHIQNNQAANPGDAALEVDRATKSLITQLSNGGDIRVNADRPSCGARCIVGGSHSSAHTA